MTFTSAFTTQSVHEVEVNHERAKVQVDVQVVVVSDTTRCLLVVSVKSVRVYPKVVLVDNLAVAQVLVETLVVDRQAVLQGLVEVTQVLVDVIVVLDVDKHVSSEGFAVTETVPSKSASAETVRTK